MWTKWSCRFLGWAVWLLGAGIAQSPAVRLHYEFPVDALMRTLQQAPEASIETLIADGIATVRSRLGELANVERDGAAGFVVEVVGDDAALLAVRARVERVGQLQMRAIAIDDPAAGELRLARERERLEHWLGAGGRARVLADPAAIDRFAHEVPESAVAAGRLGFCVHRVRVQPDRPGTWGVALSRIPGLAPAAVPLFDDAQFGGGIVPPDTAALPPAEQHLVELVAVDRQGEGFGNADFDPGQVRFVPAQQFVLYEVVPERVAAYRAFSRALLRRHVAILYDDEVRSAPRFEAEVGKTGAIAGAFSAVEFEALAAVLRSRPLPVLPVLLRREPAGR